MKLFFSALVCLAMTTTAMAADIVVFGDSWGTYGRSEFSKMAAARNLTVDNRAIGGTTAAYWANPNRVNNLRDYVRANPDCKYVWVTIGGNDAIPKMIGRQPIDDIIAETLVDTRKFFDPLFEDNSEVQLVIFGYDILFWDINVACSAGGTPVFWQCDGRVGSAEWNECSNDLFFNVQTGFAEGLAREYSQVSAPNLLGTMQGRPGNPDMSQLSPSNLGTGGACIHANNRGYELIFAELWKQFFYPLTGIP